ncbi:NADH-quinone oxidoreductase subunit H [Kineococcus sp. LSe6-4]|uniref:NADH-quinone oxidoreductase subunit H n=1 Tax=Kineococcus halophytocola TaxID=3234027 RepID=A0ABV4H619_9ACTN
MPDADVVAVSAAWAPLVLLLVVAGAWWAASVDAVSSGAGWGAPVAETARLLRQRRRSLLAADRLLWRLGGGGLLVVALLMAAVVPLGRWTMADLGVGLVWFNAMDVLVWALVWMAGWGPNSAHALVGGYRFLAQALAYELPLMFALTAPAVAAGSLRVADVVAAQQELWFVVWMPVAFVVFCGCVVAFSVHGPFAAAAGADVGGGVLAEVSGVDRLLLLAGRYALLTAGSAFAVVVFLGGGSGPWLPAWVWTLGKTFALLAVLVPVRRRVPLLRPDRLVELGWVVVLPLTLLQLLVVSIVVSSSWS